jgi:hypothetical protein
LIISAPPYNHALEKYQNAPLQRAYIGIWDIFQHAVVGLDVGCNLAPTTATPEYGGVPVNAGPPVDTWEGKDDNHYVGGDDGMTFQPIVTAFEGPLEWNMQGTSSTLIGRYCESSIMELLQRMDEELDKRMAVGNWIYSHPQQARHLSPDDFYAILSKVTFSLDQPPVVRELVAAFEGCDNLICQHIVSSMNACPYQKAEVAMIMAPFVSDSQNQNAVLCNIDYSLDKNLVTEKFPSQL